VHGDTDVLYMKMGGDGDILKTYGNYTVNTAAPASIYWRTDAPCANLVKSSYIYLSRVLCLSVCDCVCVSQFVSERSAIFLVLEIKLTKETRGRD
jgi:hypothetical protein